MYRTYTAHIYPNKRTHTSSNIYFMEKENIKPSTSAEAENKTDETVSINLVTHEPSLLNKIMQMYWFNPKSWLLNEFRVENGMIYISTMNGNNLSAPISDCKFTYQKDTYDRMEFQVKTGDEKLHFKELPGMLEEEEWTTIKDFIQKSCNTKLSGIGKVSNALKFVTGKMEELNED